jgi:hypothetical protein
VYFRGGVYYTTDVVYLTSDGEAGNPIKFFNYPGETPILDGANKRTTSIGLYISYSTNLYIKGLTVRNNIQYESNNLEGSNFFIFRSDNITLENCVSSNAVRGIWIFEVEHVYVYNCDSYNMVDPLSPTPGNAGDGFLVDDYDQTSDISSYVVFRGCRAWNTSDDGWDVQPQGYVELDNCWAINCGGYAVGGYGNGFKLMLPPTFPRDFLSRKVTNCISAYSRNSGFTTNDNNGEAVSMNIYNNLAYHNNHGFTIYGTASSDQKELLRILKNNVAYGNSAGSAEALGGAVYTHDHNTWDSSVTVTDADFASLDYTQLLLPRKADGSLPDITFGHLVAGSDLIDRGVNVGLPYSGSAPDLGAFEYSGTTCTDTCSSLGFTCGYHIVCGSNISCGTCPTGNVYYVATNGSDSNSGTITAPFKTIQHAADIVKPGDTVIVRNGTYQSTGYSIASLTTSGTAQAPITFKSENKWGAVLDGVNTGNYAIITNGASYINIQDFEIKNFYNIAIIANDAAHPSNYVTVKGCKIHDIGRYETTSAYGICGIYLGAKNSYWTIQSNMFYNIGRTGPDTYYLNKDHAVYTYATSNPSDATHHINILYNIIWGCSGGAFDIGSNDILIANNVVAWPNTNSQGSTYFIAATDIVTNFTIVNNIFYQPPSYVIWTYSPCVGWSVKNNMVYGGRMWVPETYDANKAAAMDGNNYGKTDCENAEVNPLFVNAIKTNAPNVDFHLQSSSPAINKGINVSLTQDYSGNPIVGLPDIGAYEYSGTTCTDTCTSLGYTCGYHIVCGSNISCGVCPVGNSYYVSSSTGSDSNPGTITQPWAHHPWMSSWTGSVTLQPGDTVYMKRGDTWSISNPSSAFITVKQSGSSGKYITTTAYGTGAKPLIQISTNTQQAIVYAGAKSFIKFDNIELRHYNATLMNGYYYGMRIDVSGSSVCHDWIITNCDIHDIPYIGIYAAINAYNIIVGDTTATSTATPTSYSNHIYNCGFAGIMFAGSDPANLNSNFYVYYNYVNNIDVNGPDQDRAYGISFSSQGSSNGATKNCYVRYNYVNNVPTWTGIDIHNGENIYFQDNYVGNSYLGFGCQAVDKGGTWAPTLKNLYIERNIIENPGNHFASNYYFTQIAGASSSGAANINIRNNTYFYTARPTKETGAYGIKFSYVNDSLIDRNYFYNGPTACQGAIVMINNDNNITISNNLIKNWYYAIYNNPGGGNSAISQSNNTIQ